MDELPRSPPAAVEGDNSVSGEIETEIFYTEDIDDGLGEGKRLYTSEDTVYELRNLGSWGEPASRVYREDDQWKVKTRFAVDGEEAYERFKQIAERIEEEYDADLLIPALQFMEDGQNSISTGSIDGRVQYNEEPEKKLSANDHPKLAAKSVAAWASSYTGTGIGAAMLLDPTGTSAMLGGVLGIVGFIGDAIVCPIATPGRKLSSYIITKHITEPIEEKERIEDLNRRKRLETLSKDSTDYSKAEEFKELDDEGLVERMNLALEFHCNSFEKMDGLTTNMAAESYSEAIRFAATVLDREQPEREEPSIYTDVDAFSHMVEELPGQDRLVLVQNVIEQEDANQRVQTYLEEEHPRLLDEAGERILKGGEPQ